MLNLALSSLALFGAVAFAQDRCDAPYPNVYCNTTEILAYQSSDCSPYHVFVARGSDEPYPGRLGNITSEICKQIGNDKCSFENVEYPAKSTAWGKDEWCKSAGKGASNGQAQVKAYAEKCSDSKLILLGFSQGAAVTQDILGGGGGQVFECTQDTSPALDRSTSPGSQVVAAVTFGAVVRSKGQNFTVGEGVNYDGQRARTPEQLEALQKYSNVLLDYCHYGDPMCAVGSDPANVTAHLDYFLEHNEEVSRWIAGKAKGKAVSAPNHSQSASTSTSVSPAKATTGAATPKSMGSTATTGLATEASQTSSASNNGSTGAGSTLSAYDYIVSVMVVLATTLFSVALL